MQKRERKGKKDNARIISDIDKERNNKHVFFLFFFVGTFSPGPASPTLDNQFMKRNVLMPVPKAKESSSSTRPGLFVLLFYFWTVWAQFARVSSSTLHRCWCISIEKTAIVTFFPKFYDVLNRCLEGISSNSRCDSIYGNGSRWYFVKAMDSCEG